MIYKFRGKTPDGQIVYGDLSTIGKPWAIVNRAGVFPVINNSVRQLVGFIGETEIYEGDPYIDNFDIERLAYPIEQNFAYCKLVANHDNH